MKKIITLISVACMALFISCGPSAEEKAKIEQQRLDSLNAVMEQQRQDSIALAEKVIQDSIIAVQKATEDSLKMKAIQDSMAALQGKIDKINKPKKPKTIEQKKIEEVKKATQGRG